LILKQVFLIQRFKDFNRWSISYVNWYHVPNVNDDAAAAAAAAAADDDYDDDTAAAAAAADDDDDDAAAADDDDDVYPGVTTYRLDIKDISTYLLHIV